MITDRIEEPVEFRYERLDKGNLAKIFEYRLTKARLSFVNIDTGETFLTSKINFEKVCSPLSYEGNRKEIVKESIDQDLDLVLKYPYLKRIVTA